MGRTLITQLYLNSKGDQEIQSGNFSFSRRTGLCFIDRGFPKDRKELQIMSSRKDDNCLLQLCDELLRNEKKKDSFPYF